MPNRDGSGPAGQGPGQGTGRYGGAGKGRRRMNCNNQGASSEGECICPSCGTRISHQTGISCSSLNCSKCGAKMTRG